MVSCQLADGPKTLTVLQLTTDYGLTTVIEHFALISCGLPHEMFLASCRREISTKLEYNVDKNVRFYKLMFLQKPPK